MDPIIFRVRRLDEGWFVEGPQRMGPFVAREQAVDLAEGMAKAIRELAQPVIVTVEDDAGLASAA